VKGQARFKIADVIPNTFGAFATVRNSHSDAVVETVDIEMLVPAGPAELDTVVVTQR
jgi:hypothetical protein